VFDSVEQLETAMAALRRMGLDEDIVARAGSSPSPETVLPRRWIDVLTVGRAPQQG
jgi:hypothetical protein